MDIPLGDQIGEPIAILCHGPRNARVWSGVVKLHLKNPEIDAIALLQGTRIFSILLDQDAPTIPKVAKSYDSLAPSSLLSIKIASETIKDLEAHHLIKVVVEDSFRRGLEFEISQAQKNPGETYDWLVTTSPEQLTKLNTSRIGILNELIRPIATNTCHERG